MLSCVVLRHYILFRCVVSVPAYVVFPCPTVSRSYPTPARKCPTPSRLRSSLSCWVPVFQRRSVKRRWPHYHQHRIITYPETRLFGLAIFRIKTFLNSCCYVIARRRGLLKFRYAFVYFRQPRERQVCGPSYPRNGLENLPSPLFNFDLALSSARQAIRLNNDDPTVGRQIFFQGNIIDMQRSFPIVIRPLYHIIYM